MAEPALQRLEPELGDVRVVVPLRGLDERRPRSSGWSRNSAMFGLSSRFVASTSAGRTSPRRSIACAMD